LLGDAVGDLPEVTRQLYLKTLERESAPDPEGYLRSLLLLDPVPLATPLRQGEALSAGVVPKDAAPREGDVIEWSGRKLTWRPFISAGTHVDLHRHAAAVGRPGENALFYGVVYLWCDEAVRDVRLSIGSDDGSVWWLNGREL